MWGTLLEDHSGEKRALSLEAIDRERVVPSFCLVLYGLSSPHRRNWWCGDQACAHFMLSVAASLWRKVGRKREATQ